MQTCLLQLNTNNEMNILYCIGHVPCQRDNRFHGGARAAITDFRRIGLNSGSGQKRMPPVIKQTNLFNIGILFEFIGRRK